ncbi:hypothetical protein cypCar_00039985, partial [Cyprinus carpio]
MECVTVLLFAPHRHLCRWLCVVLSWREPTVLANQAQLNSFEEAGEKSAQINHRLQAKTIQNVWVDFDVVLKIIKHYQEEGQGSEVVQGVLLGLVVEDSLEITNCFPFPQHTEDDVDFDEVQYQMEMMRSLRHVNIDHLHVGWYQSTHYGSFVSRALLDSQFSYQHAIEESVVLIY